ncbi:uncharacterized protein LOC126599142 [Malus sylvestris]|uniref:uncharacterized protein LOC126599142 n=1 Tax=Malus sylvestris TaxID=3752 RepID=UPI0021AC96F5|nr:uncharacterized protein LOC126599142 [Malus sylvestris]
MTTMATMGQNLICISPSLLFHPKRNPVCSILYTRDMNIIRATNITPPLVLVAGNMGKTRSLSFPRAVPNFVTDSRIAGTEYVSARAGENSPTYGVYPPRPHPSLYPVYHPVNVTPACFAVNEFNKETNAKLHIVRVVAALEELRCGYFRQLLTLEVLDEGVAKFYEAVVETKSGSNDMSDKVCLFMVFLVVLFGLVS